MIFFETELSKENSHLKKKKILLGSQLKFEKVILQKKTNIFKTIDYKNKHLRILSESKKKERHRKKKKKKKRKKTKRIVKKCPVRITTAEKVTVLSESPLQASKCFIACTLSLTPFLLRIRFLF